jgi:hypothetical protein
VGCGIFLKFLHLSTLQPSLCEHILRIYHAPDSTRTRTHTHTHTHNNTAPNKTLHSGQLQNFHHHHASITYALQQAICFHGGLDYFHKVICTCSARYITSLKASTDYRPTVSKMREIHKFLSNFVPLLTSSLCSKYQINYRNEHRVSECCHAL